MRSIEGFSLVEVVVAFVVLAISLVGLQNLTTNSLRATAAASARSDALMIAQSKLAMAGAALPLVQGRYEGTESDSYKWEIVVASGDEKHSGMYWVDVTVSWSHGGSTTTNSLSLTTAKLRSGQ